MEYHFDHPKTSSVLIEDAYLGGEMLNLGCGQRILPGFTNLDRCQNEGVDVVCNVEEEDLPFPEDHFDLIYMKDILEHMPHRVRRVEGEFFYHLIEDLIRVSLDDAHWIILSPCHFGDLQAPGHCRLIGPASFMPWNHRISDLEATTIPTARLHLIDQKNIRWWNLNWPSRFGRVVHYRLVYRVSKRIQGGS